jgi:2-polyprenyl-6-methoxyphenol hydroxylase-like FAD-dependent oxidoreductase
MADVIIVGGGIAGGALSIALARGGLDVVVLERSDRYEDRVRGEWLAPWGAAEARELGLYDLLRDAGGHTLATHTTYDETLDPAMAEEASFPLDTFAKDIAGPLCLGHPATCDLYDTTARAEGVTIHRGVTALRIEAGSSPRVAYHHNDTDKEVAARIVVGADGRDSAVRRQLGIGHHEDPTHHLFGGLLVDNAGGWPEHRQVIATEGDRSFLAFPQGGGRVRLYAAYRPDEKGRFSGPDGPQRFIDACVMDCCPPSAALANAVAIGPCRSFKNSDTITEHIALPGVVLVGDSAGHNDPLIGQGLSITLRDVRMVRDTLLEGEDWSPSAFADYANDRRERMRRLRLAAGMQAKIEAEFGEGPREFRKQFFEALAIDPNLGAGITAALGGPDAVPGELYDQLERDFDFPERPAWPLTP